MGYRCKASLTDCPGWNHVFRSLQMHFLPMHSVLTCFCTQFGFTGISTFAHLKHVKCLTHPYEPFDIGIIGAPFDTSVSYRPGMHSPPTRTKHLIACYRLICPLPSPSLWFCSGIYLPIRCTLRATCHSIRQWPPNHFQRLQPPRPHQPLHIMAVDPRLW